MLSSGGVATSCLGWPRRHQVHHWHRPIFFSSTGPLSWTAICSEPGFSGQSRSFFIEMNWNSPMPVPFIPSPSTKQYVCDRTNPQEPVCRVRPYGTMSIDSCMNSCKPSVPCKSYQTPPTIDAYCGYYTDVGKQSIQCCPECSSDIRPPATSEMKLGKVQCDKYDASGSCLQWGCNIEWLDSIHKCLFVRRLYIIYW